MLLVIFGHLHEADVAHLQIRGDCSSPKQLSHPPLHKHLLEEKSKQPILSLRVPQPKEEILVTLGIDVGYALIVPVNGELVAGGYAILMQEGDFVDEQPEDHPKDHGNLSHLPKVDIV